MQGSVHRDDRPHRAVAQAIDGVKGEIAVRACPAHFGFKHALEFVNYSRRASDVASGAGADNAVVFAARLDIERAEKCGYRENAVHRNRESFRYFLQRFSRKITVLSLNVLEHPDQVAGVVFMILCDFTNGI